MQVVLGSSSPARLRTLQAAGIDPVVIEPDIDESQVINPSAADLTAKLAALKGEAVLSKARAHPDLVAPYVIIACDSMLEISGRIFGKPGTPEAAIVRWHRMRGREGLLFTGHYVAVVDDEVRADVRTACTEVKFADLTEDEILAYAHTSEPERVAGGFTIDGYGGAFVTGIKGDPHNVVGISLPLVRQILVDLTVSWHSLWR